MEAVAVRALARAVWGRGPRGDGGGGVGDGGGGRGGGGGGEGGGEGGVGNDGGGDGGREGGEGGGSGKALESRWSSGDGECGVDEGGGGEAVGVGEARVVAIDVTVTAVVEPGPAADQQPCAGGWRQQLVVTLVHSQGAPGERAAPWV